MKLGQLVSTARDVFTAKLVYGEPVERDGVVVIPAAAVFGGGGGGGADDSDALPVREGAGFGVLARPAGAFVIRDGTVAWVPAVDVTRLGLAAAVTVVALAKILAKRTRS
ncbi:spore germination protein GerW family protein [Amycolatopsis sp. NPDC026612]|uniref:spore germination protein GerW family protein n=1 Tax=Amycolatopsis sp. NPDC026612 TaxID=3155466 RepID=UPI0033C91D8A